MRANPTRQGFLILIMIAFSSILLGLATTFFIYCSKALDSSAEAVRYAQSRIALHGALAYTMNAIRARPNTSNLLAAIADYSGSPPILNGGWFKFDDMSSPQNMRATKGGYMRISAVPGALGNATAFNVLNTPTLSPAPGGTPVEVYLTVGSGPSGGDLSMRPVLPVEIRRCYRLEIFISAAATAYTLNLIPITPLY